MWQNYARFISIKQMDFHFLAFTDFIKKKKNLDLNHKTVTKDKQQVIVNSCQILEKKFRKIWFIIIIILPEPKVKLKIIFLTSNSEHPKQEIVVFCANNFMQWPSTMVFVLI